MSAAQRRAWRGGVPARHPRDSRAQRSFPLRSLCSVLTPWALQSLMAGGLRPPRRRVLPWLMRTLDPHSLTKHVDRLYRAAWALCGSREDAEDLVQETFARVLSRPRVLRGDDELYYLLRTLRNTFFTSRRTASRRPVTVAAPEDVVAADPRPMGQPEQALDMQEVYATIAALPEDRRLALVAVDVLGLSYREAARALRVREATITTRLFRAREQVARELAPAPDSSTSTSAEPGSPDLTHASPPRHPPSQTVRGEDTPHSGVLPSRATH
jgi:RNA polymerase sigma-70 factor (ECF subfamily)